MTINNLYVTYDEDGTPHFHVNDEEVTEQEWKLRHPMMKEDKANGGNLNGPSSGRVSNSAVAAIGSDVKERQRQGLRDYRAKLKAQGVGDHVEGQDEETGGGGAGQGENAVG